MGKRWAGAACGAHDIPEGAGIEINSVRAHNNLCFGGVDRRDSLVVPQQRVLPEDVLR